jgi:hypothetical protein
MTGLVLPKMNSTNFVSARNMARNHLCNTSISIPGTPAGAPSTRARDPVADFKRGIKHDAYQIAIVKDEKQLDNWQRTTMAETKTQDIAEVLDPTSTPTTVEDKALFREKQTCIAEVLDPTCTPTISAFVRSKSTNADSFGDERRALIRGSIAYANSRHYR